MAVVTSSPADQQIAVLSRPQRRNIMKISIIGAGNMSRGIGSRLVAGGHAVTISDVDAGKAKTLASELAAGKGGAKAEAVAADGEYLFTDGDQGGTTVFLRDGERIFQTYAVFGGRLDVLNGLMNYLDLTPLGRQDVAIRHHDRY